EELAGAEDEHDDDDGPDDDPQGERVGLDPTTMGAVPGRLTFAHVALGAEVGRLQALVHRPADIGIQTGAAVELEPTDLAVVQESMGAHGDTLLADRATSHEIPPPRVG